MTAPRGLTPDEKDAWERLAASVTPLHPARPARTKPAAPVVPVAKPPAQVAPTAHRPVSAVPAKPATPALARALPPASGSAGLDSHWDRRFKSGTIAPDFTLDLHGHTLDSAHRRLDDGLMQAKAMDARVVLLIAGRERPVHAADRGEKRGAIRAKILDWLAAGPHAADIAAIRPAHRKHGGAGALYLVLKRRR